MRADEATNGLVPDLVVAVFRLNGTLIEMGNELVGQLGLTTAWWQVLGALFHSPTPLPVAHIARNMGLSRQSVQRNVDLLANKGMVRFAPNPHHQRAKLVILTAAGVTAMEAADARQQPVGRQLEASIGTERLAAALAVLSEVEVLLCGATNKGKEFEKESIAAKKFRNT